MGGLYWLIISPTPQYTAFESIAGISWGGLVSSSPRVAEGVSNLMRFVGLYTATIGIYVIAVSTKSYRRGERWAWYTFWTLPAISAIGLAVDSSGGVGTFLLLWDSTFTILPALGLLLPYRKFFPRKQP